MTKSDQGNRWFGIDYHMNLYKGCNMGCIYCDSRCEAYHIDDFDKVHLCVGKILEAKKHPKADKLLVFKVDIGSSVRQIVSGIAKWYKPDDLVGKKVVVVKNLAPVKLRGELSEGMLLCAADKDDKVLELLNVDSLNPGDEIR